MATRLQRNVFAVLVIMALCAALVLASPAPVQAQAASTVGDNQKAHAVVRPGDSLWTISEEQLGPDATPQRIANGVEQIYALNSERIGADPALILVGQKLLVPRAMVSERPTTVTPARKNTVEAAGGDLRDQATRNTADKAPRTAPGGADAEGSVAFETVAERKPEPAGLSDVAVAAPVPVVASMASNDAQPSSAVSFLGIMRAEFASAASMLGEVFFWGSADASVQERRSLGLGIIALTLVVAVLMARKLPMRRTTRWDAELWGIAASYHGGLPTADRIAPFVFHPGSLGGSDETRDDVWDTRSRAPAAVGGARRISFVTRPGRKGSATNGRRPAPKAKAVARNGLALGVHHPQVRRVPLRIHSTMRAQKLRPRRRPTRQPKVVSIRGGR